MNSKKKALIKKNIPLYILLLPSAVLLFCFAYLPLGGLVMAFQDYSPALGILKSPFVGFSILSSFLNHTSFR